MKTGIDVGFGLRIDFMSELLVHGLLAKCTCGQGKQPAWFVQARGKPT